MSTRDSEGYVLETAETTASLPDPTTVNGRTHVLTNTGTATVVWSSVGATPFQQGGVNAATLSVARGQAIQVQSDGTHWVAKSGGARPFFAGTAVTDASGNAVFNLTPAGFTAAPVAAFATEFAASSNPIDARITAKSATSITVNVRQSPTLVVLSLSVLGVAAPIAGVTIHLIATPSGTTP